MQIGQCNDNSAADLARWTGAIGAPAYVDIAFDGSSPDALQACIPWIISTAKALNVPVRFTVPFPGDGHLEDVEQGSYDFIYVPLFQQLAEAFPEGAIPIRIAQEPASGWQVGSTAKNKAGDWDAHTWKGAFTHLSWMARSETGNRAEICICFNVTGNQIDPATLLPEVHTYDTIGADFYMKVAAGNKPGDFPWFRDIRSDNSYGLAYLLSLAKGHSKPLIIPECGMDSDTLLADFQQFLAWCQTSSVTVMNYWDRNDGGSQTMISDGSKPAILAAVKALAV